MKKSNLILVFVVAVFLGIVIAESLNQAALTGATLLAAVVTALVTGSIYAIAASGLVVTYQTSGIFNFAQGAIGMFAAFLYWELRVDQHWPAPIALIAVILVAAPLFGAGIERVLMRRVVDSPLVVQLIVTIGLMFLLMGLAATIWNENTIAPLPPFFASSPGVTLGSVVVTWAQIITIAVAIVIAVFLRVLLHRSRTGMAMRAVVDNRALAGLTGARPGRLSALAWAIGSSMAAIAGILLAPTAGLRVDILTLFIIDAFAAAIIGRLRSLPWTFAGGLIIGVATSFATAFLNLNGRWATSSIAIPAIILFIALLALPQARIELGRLAPKYRVPRVGKLWETGVGMVALLVVIVLIVEFAGLQETDTRRITLAMVTALIMLSYVPLTGWAGQISLAQITFVGVGAFAMSQVAGQAGQWFHPGSPLGLVAAAGLAVPFGVLMALPALRLQGLYLALASLAFGVMAIPLFFNQPEVFGATDAHIATLSIFGINFNDASTFLIAMTVIFALMALFLVWVRRGRFGRRLIALRDSPAASATVGVNLVGTKLAVFALSAAIAGFAGGLLGMFRGTAGAMDFQITDVLAIGALLLLVVWGVSTTSGALFGGIASVLLVILQADVTWIIFGVSVFVTITRIGPGLASFSVVQSPEGVGVDAGARLARFLPWRQDARDDYQAERRLKRETRAARTQARRGGSPPSPPSPPLAARQPVARETP
jgi:branched-chain amino acid transport system permease protein